MDNLDFVRIATDVVNEFRLSFEGSKSSSFVNTVLYVSIKEDGNIKTSNRSEVLKGSRDCLIILTYNELAITNYYDWYAIRYIDEDGNVHNGYSQNGFTIEIETWGSYSNKRMTLHKNGIGLFDIGKGLYQNPWDEPIHKLWEVYQLVKDCRSDDEAMYIAENVKLKDLIRLKDEKISALDFAKQRIEMQMKEYKKLLDDISRLIND